MVLPQLLYQLAIFLVSIAFLSKFSHMVIKHSVRLARMTKIGELVIGFILLSVATSAPELAVSFSAITAGNLDISIGNLLGSNVANLTFVLAIPAIIVSIRVRKGTFEKLLTILFLSSVIPLLLLALAEMSSIIGIVLIAVFILFSLYSVRRKITLEIITREPRDIMQKFLRPFEFYKSVGLLCIGLVGLMVSARFVVTSATSIAQTLAIAGSIIGATIIALGTSLPEFSIGLTAIKKNRASLALGNTIGSCLTNLTLILGIVLLFSPVGINIGIFSTLLVFVIITTIIVWYFFSTGRRLDRMEGVILLFIYIIFLISTFTIQYTL